MEHLSDEMTLNIGCGPISRKPAEIGVDLRFDVGPDVVGDMRALPFRDECFGRVIASHVLEHVPIWDTEPSLREMRRVLSPTGTLQVHVPDMGWVAGEIIKGRLTPWLIPVIYGAAGGEGWNHLMGFDAPLLVGYVRLAGFRETEVVARAIGIEFWGPGDSTHKSGPVRRDNMQELRVEARKK